MASIGAPLGLIGAFINSADDSTETVSRSPVSTQRNPSGNNIYDSNDLSDAQRLEVRRARVKHMEAKRPGSGVIGSNYRAQEQARNKSTGSGSIANQMAVSDSGDGDSVFSDDGSSMADMQSQMSSLDMNDPTALFNRAERISNNNTFEQRAGGATGRNGRPMGRVSGQHPSTGDRSCDYRGQFEFMTVGGDKPVASNNVGQSGNNRWAIERELELSGGYSSLANQDMTYGVVDKERMTHHNMVPQPRMKAGYTHDPASESRLAEQTQRKVDLYTGSLNNLQYKPKTERRPLFNPIVGLTNNGFGMQNHSDYYQSRYIPSRERRNELPFKQEQVGPGLNLSYNENSKTGYVDLFRPLYKTTNELRTADNPKISYGNRVVRGMMGHKRATLPTVAQYKPNTFRENDTKDLVKSLGYIRGPTIHGNYDAPATQRSLSNISWFGGGEHSTDKPLPDHLLPKRRISRKQNYNHAGPMPAGLVEGQRATPNPNSYNVQTTRRQLTQDNDFVNAPAGFVQKGHARDLNDVPDATLRDIYANTDYTGPVGGFIQKGHARDLNDVPDPTLRDLTLERSWITGPTGLVNKGHAQNLYDVPDPTRKDLHTQTNWVANAGGLIQKGHARDLNDAPNATRKDLHIESNWVANAGGLIQKGHARDLSDVPDATRKDLHAQTNWVANAGGLIQKGHARDLNDVPDATRKDLYAQTNWVANAGGLIKKGHARDLSDVPDATRKDLHAQTNWVANAGGLVQKGHARDLTDVPDATRKDLYAQTNWVANAGGLVQKGHARDLTDVPDPTRKDLHIENNWVANAGGFVQKGHARDLTDVPDATRKDLYAQNNRIAGAGGFVQKGHARDLSDVPDPTRKDLHIENNWVANAGGFVQKGHARNLDDVPDPTRKDMTIEARRVAGVGGLIQKGHARNLDDVPDPTLKDITIENNWVNSVKFNPRGGYLAEEKGTYAPTTKRQLTQENTHVRPAAGFHDKGGYLAEEKGTYAPTTKRQMTQHNNYVNPASYHEKQRSRADANSMLINEAKEAILKGRKPTTSNYNKGPTMQFTNVELCDPIQINRELYPTMYGQNVMQCLPTTHTQIGNRQLPNAGWRFNNHIADVLRTNPFVNNTQHRVIQG